MEKWVSLLSSLFLLVLAAFAWGWSAGELNVFPADKLRSIQSKVHDFLEGGDGSRNLTVTEKLANDMGGRPHRLLVDGAHYSVTFDGCGSLSTGFNTDMQSCSLQYLPNNHDQFKSRHLAYGPYVHLAEGKYNAEIIYRASSSPDALIGHVDVVSGLGAHGILPPRPVTATGAKRARKTLEFELNRPHRNVEVRLFLKEPVTTEILSIKLARQAAVHPPNKIQLDIPDLRDRRQSPYVLSASTQLFREGYLLVFGTIDMKGALHGLFLINDVGQVIHTIPLDESYVRRAIEHNAPPVPDNYDYKALQTIFPHGFEILRDGSVIVNDGDSGNTIRRIDWCGQPVWTKYVRSHHAVNASGDSFWHLQEPLLFLERDIETGEVLQEISLGDVLTANPKMGVLQIRQTIYEGEWRADPHHVNDVEPLPRDIAHAFPMFEAGDLLISLRSLDLVTVLDQKTLKIKWWRAGPWRRQHDPDWQPDGTITVFDNQMVEKSSFGASRIVRIDPATMATEVVYNGAKHDVYTPIRGTHQMRPDGAIIMSVPQQGRVVGINPDGSLGFDLRNTYDSRDNLLLSGARHIPPDYFAFDPADRRCHPDNMSMSAK